MAKRLQELSVKTVDENEKFVIVDTGDSNKTKLVASSEVSKVWHTHTASDVTDFDTEVSNNTTVAGKLDKDWELRTWNGARKVSHTDASGDEVELALGADGEFLQSNWPAVAPTFWTIPTPVIDIQGRFGTGADWAVTISSNTTLTSDMNYTDLTINSGIVLSPDWYRIFVSWTLTNEWTIRRNWATWNDWESPASILASSLWWVGVLLAQGSLNDQIISGAWSDWQRDAGGSNAVPWTDTNPSYITWNWWDWWSSGTYEQNNWGVAWTTTRGANYNALITLEWIIALLSFPQTTTFAELDSVLYAQYLWWWTAGWWGWWGSNDSWSRWGWWGWWGGHWWVIFISAKTIINNGVFESNWWDWWDWWAPYESGGDIASGWWGWWGWCWGAILAIYETRDTTWTNNFSWGAWGAWGVSWGSYSWFAWSAWWSGALISIQV